LTGAGDANTVGHMIGSLLGGIGLFLLGMILMTDGLKTAAGDALRRVLLRFTGGPFRAMLSGATITALVQSSSATTLTTIGFVSAGILTFQQAVGVIFGSNLGTTSTGWLVSLLGFKVSIAAYALPMVGIGALLNLLGRGRLRAVGLALAGFGLIFVGIDQLQSAMAVVATKIDPSMFPKDSFGGRLALVGIGVLMTVVMQSSSAAVATTLAALHSQAIGLEQAAALVIGQNIGTTVTAGVAAIGASNAAKRTALAHALFNALTGVVAFLILPFFVKLTLWVADDLDGAAGGGDAAVALAIFHTLFNFLGVALLLPFVGPFAAWVSRLVPDRSVSLTRYLDSSVGQIGSVGVEVALRTAKEIGAALTDLLQRQAAGTPAPDGPATFEAVKAAIAETRRFLAQVQSSPDVESEYRRQLGALHALDHLEELAEAAAMPPPPVPLTDKGEAVRARVVETLAGARSWMTAAQPDPPLGESAEVAAEATRTVLSERRRVLADTAAGRLDPELADVKIGRLRWLERVARHLSRSLHHLSGQTEADAGEPQSPSGEGSPTGPEPASPGTPA
jgi:phosphate:Na+ symporter